LPRGPKGQFGGSTQQSKVFFVISIDDVNSEIDPKALKGALSDLKAQKKSKNSQLNDKKLKE